MNLELSQEQQMLKQAATRFFAKELPSKLVKELQGPTMNGHSAKFWSQMAELGWLGLVIAEDYGGAGCSLVDLGILYEEAGRALVPTTLYSTMFAALVVTVLGTEEQQLEYLTSIAQGEMIGTVAYAEPEAIHNPTFFKTTARMDGENWLLSGTKMFVSNAHLADPIIAIGNVCNEGASEGLTAFLVTQDTPGVTIEPQLTFGKDRQSIVRFKDARLPAEAVLGGARNVGQVESGLELAMRQATALQCAEMVGGASKVLEMTVSYVSERQQFGRPIGSFQAVQHHLADMATAVDGARLATYQALSLLSEGQRAERHIAIAKAVSGEAYKAASIMAHHLWGGMGYSIETDLYLYSNRAKATEIAFGTRDLQIRHLGDLLARA